MRTLLKSTLMMGTAVVMLVTGLGVPNAAAQAADATIHACLQDPDRDGDGRLVRIVSTSAPCKRKETRLTWNAKGPKGDRGPGGSTADLSAIEARLAVLEAALGGQQGGVPTGTVAFFALDACPAGWSDFLAAHGRYLVGMPLDGTLGAEVGTALMDREDRPVGAHTHGVNDPGHHHGYWDTAPKFAPVFGYGYPFALQAPGGSTLVDLDSRGNNWVTQSAFTGITISPAGAIEGTNAPYLQLLSCHKD